VILLFVVAAAATALAVWQRWYWLSVATFLIVTPLWWVHVAIDESPHDLATMAVLIPFGALTAVAAVAFARRGFGLLTLNALVLGFGCAGFLVHHAAAWIVGVIAVHVVLAAAVLRGDLGGEPGSDR